MVVALIDVGGIGGLADEVRPSDLGEAGLHAWEGLGVGGDNPLGAKWIATVFGLGFVLSFGYWTTNFRRGPARAVGTQHVGGAADSPDRRLPEAFIPALVVVPKFGSARRRRLSTTTPSRP